MGGRFSFLLQSFPRAIDFIPHSLYHKFVCSGLSGRFINDPNIIFMIE